MPAGASRNAADLGRGQVVQIDATGALSKEASGGGLITAHGRCGQPTLAKQPFTIGIDQLTHHIPRRRVIRRHCTDIDQVCPQQHQSLPKHAMTTAISVLIGDERVDVGRVEPIHRPAMDGQPATEPTTANWFATAPGVYPSDSSRRRKPSTYGSNSQSCRGLPAMPVPSSRTTLL